MAATNLSFGPHLLAIAAPAAGSAPEGRQGRGKLPPAASPVWAVLVWDGWHWRETARESTNSTLRPPRAASAELSSFRPDFRTSCVVVHAAGGSRKRARASQLGPRPRRPRRRSSRAGPIADPGYRRFGSRDMCALPSTSRRIAVAPDHPPIGHQRDAAEDHQSTEHHETGQIRPSVAIHQSDQKAGDSAAAARALGRS